MVEEDQALQEIIEGAIEAIDRCDSFDATAQLLSVGTVERVVDALNLAIRELFSQRKLSPMVWIGRSGLEFILQHAQTTTDAKQQASLRKAARALSYNVSANLWTGWGDEAVLPTLSDQAAALDLARLHLRLVESDHLEQELLGNAHWLVGAQRLALGQEQAAHHSFETAKTAYHAGGHHICEAMAEGYVALALLQMASMATEGEQRFKNTMTRLEALGEDGDFFADQLRTAQKIFLTRRE